MWVLRFEPGSSARATVPLPPSHLSSPYYFLTSNNESSHSSLRFEIVGLFESHSLCETPLLLKCLPFERWEQFLSLLLRPQRQGGLPLEFTLGNQCTWLTEPSRGRSRQMQAPAEAGAGKLPQKLPRWKILHSHG